MKLSKIAVPWNDKEALAVRNLPDHFAKHLPSGLSRYLPSSVTLCFDPGIRENTIAEFITEAAVYLAKEIDTRLLRCARMVELGFFQDSEIQGFLTCNRNV